MIGQKAELNQVGLDYLQEIHASLGLSADDISELVVTDNISSKHNGFTHIYYVQARNGYQVQNAMFNVTLNAEGKVIFKGNRLVPNLSEKIVSKELNVSPELAVINMAEHLGFTGAPVPTKIKSQSNNPNLITFAQSDYSKGTMTAEPKYHKLQNGQYTLAWEVFIHEGATVDSWYGYVDAGTGAVISKRQNTHKCNVGAGTFSRKGTAKACNHPHHNHNHAADLDKASAFEMTSGDGAQYFVLAVPAESPSHGPFQLVVDPSFEVASPFGWHDEDGQEGPEWTITRGNNVWAYQDSTAVDNSIGDEPDGGPDLIFNFGFDPLNEVGGNIETDVVNGFYWGNIIHDFSYIMGFDEPAGAYQNNNYGNGGLGNDQVLVETFDGSGTNNATFAPRPDGTNGVMNLFAWTNAGQAPFRVLDPNVIAREYNVDFADWVLTPPVAEVNVSGQVEIAADADPQFPTNACGELINDVQGKIALIDRGRCEFGLKALNAEDAGAIGVIICNQAGVNGGDGNELINMGAGAVGDQVTIPVVFLGLNDCNAIRMQMSTGPVTVEYRTEEFIGPSQVSSGFDNGVIAHEYGHGIYERLLGGPATVACSGNDGTVDELLSEGFTDFLGLVLTTNPGDDGSEIRGIGTYVIGEDTDGGGIRRFPYSTDMDICPLTYDFIHGQATHARGEVLTIMLWEVYWAFSEEYGWDADWTNADAGNNRAMRLIYDALKAVPCVPTFLDIRDAIFAMDGGENSCLLWEAFAKRGFGYFANVGSLALSDDNTEDFEPLPTCITTLKIRRDIVDIIEPGDEITVTIDIANHTLETATNVVVTDFIDEGLTVSEGPDNVSWNQSGNTVTFDVGDMATLDELNITYTLASDPNVASTRFFLNEVETDDEQGEFERNFGPNSASNFWSLNALDANSGVWSWFTQEIDDNADQRLIYPDIEVRGTRPVLRFQHRINSTPVERGGYVEISDDEVLWFNVGDDIIRGGYNTALSFANFVIPGLEGYSGFNGEGEFEQAFVDLSDHIGTTSAIRFRFGTYDQDDGPDNDPTLQPDFGWYVDDVEMIDLVSYITSATISADNADSQSTVEQEIFVNPDERSSLKDIQLEGVSITMYPNPTSDVVTMDIEAEERLSANVMISALDGRVMQQNRLEIQEAFNRVNLDVSTYESGMYLVQIQSGNRVTTRKLIIE